MFNKISSFIAAALVLSGVMKQALAAPSTYHLQARKANLSPNASVCTAGIGTECVTIPISSDTCINFTGGLSFLNKEVTTALIPPGFVCTFYQQFGCLSAQGGADAVVLQGGTWDFRSVPGTAATVNFNDLSSSFTCSPV